MSTKDKYEKEHNSRVDALAEVLCLVIVDQRYDYFHFGSWFFTFKCAQGTYTIAFDGRESRLELKTPDQDLYECIKYKTRRNSYRDPEILFHDVASLIKEIGNE